jgi:hypothetical protein
LRFHFQSAPPIAVASTFSYASTFVPRIYCATTIARPINLKQSECVQLHGRASALEVRVRQPLSLSRDNAVGCGLDYEADLHKYERDTAKAREKVLRAKYVCLGKTWHQEEEGGGGRGGFFNYRRDISTFRLFSSVTFLIVVPNLLPTLSLKLHFLPFVFLSNLKILCAHVQASQDSRGGALVARAVSRVLRPPGRRWVRWWWRRARLAARNAAPRQPGS